MCYSIAVSFASAAVLTGGGIALFKKVESLRGSNGVFPLLPPLFGISDKTVRPSAGQHISLSR